MKRKFLSLALCLMMVLSLIVVPTSAEGEVTLLESWFEDANGVRVYDTKNAATVTPAFYVNNGTGAAITDAKLILASYDANDKLAVVKFTAAPEIPENESRIKIADSIAVSEGGETYMMIWDGAYAPVVPKTELTTDSCDARIASFKIGDYVGLITNENRAMTKANSAITVENQYKKSIDININADADLTTIAPTITLSDAGATISPASGEIVDFSSGSINYTVTAADGTKSVYNVNVIATPYKKIYSESFGETFPTFVTSEITGLAKKGYLDKKNYLNSDTMYMISYTSEPYFRAYKGDWGEAASLRYTRAEIAANKQVLRDGEYLEVDDNGDIVYYASTTATDPLGTEDETANTDIAYVLDRNGRRVLHGDAYTVKDPVEPTGNNYVLKYEKRKNSGASATTFQYFQYGSVSSDALTSPTFNKLRYDFDLYVDSKACQNQDGVIGLWHYSSNSDAYRMYVKTENNDLLLNYRGGDSASSPSANTATLKNGCGKWNHITFIATYVSGTFSDVKIYANNELIADANYYSCSPTTKFSTSSKLFWKLSARDSASAGYFYIDNMELNVIF